MSEEFRAEYEIAADMLVRMMDGRDLHVANVPNCAAEPLCIGPAGGMELGQILGVRSRTAALLLTAIGEMCRMRQQTREALAWKRDLTDQLERSAGVYEEQIREAHAQIRALTEVIGELQGRLTAWDDAADCIGPVGDPVIES